jgi:hypothetical protein
MQQADDEQEDAHVCAQLRYFDLENLVFEQIADNDEDEA